MEFLTGVMKNTEKPILFSANKEEFCFCFMTDSVTDIGEHQQPVRLPNCNGFYYGKTHNNQNIAIYAGDNDLDIYRTRILNTGAYIISNGNVFPDELKEFSGIRFLGGALNRIFHINGIVIDPVLKDGIVGRINDDSKAFNIDIAGLQCQIELRSNTTFLEGQEGIKITNSDVGLTIVFSKSKPVSSFFTYYRNIRNLLSFLTNRKNVGFESIELLKNEDDLPVSTQSAKVYIKNNQSSHLKDYQKNITVEDLGDAFPTLFKMFFDAENNTNMPLIGFLPEDDHDLYIMSNYKLKEICSALEKELEYNTDIQVKENGQLDELKSIVKKTLKEYKKSHSDFPEGAVSLITNSIDHWSLSLRERLLALCEKYDSEIMAMNPFKIKMDEEAIKGFVKYRNNITHGNAEILSTSVAATAMLLSGVVYCSVLDRAGVPRDKIQGIVKNKVLS